MFLATSSLLKFSTYVASSFASALSDPNKPLYLYVGGSSAWEADDAPPISVDTVEAQHKIWDNMAGLIKVSRSDISVGIDRNDWSSGRTYAHYDDSLTSSTLHTGNGYVVLAGELDRDVYVCLDNNGDSLSTSKPVHRNYTKKSIRESDGYTWKYLYSISDSDFVKFATSKVIPAKTSAKVATESTEGAIYNILLADAAISTGTGSGYRGTGYSNGTSWVIAANVSFSNSYIEGQYSVDIEDSGNGFSYTTGSYFSNSMLYVTSGLSSGSMRRIIASEAGNGTNPSTVALDLNTALPTVVAGDSVIIGPEVSIQNDRNGRLFSGVGVVNGEGKINEVLFTSHGKDYANGSMVVHVNGNYNLSSVSGVIGSGSGASLSAYLTPARGHGNRSEYDLGAKYAIISVAATRGRTLVNEQGVFCGIDNEIRQIGLVHSPMISGNRRAYSQSYDLRSHLYFNYDLNSIANKLFLDNLSGTNKDAKIINNTTNATGILWGTHLSGGSIDSSKRWISITNRQGNFSDGDTVYVDDGASGLYSTAISSSDLSSYDYPENSMKRPVSSVVHPEVTKYTGDIIYHENISPIPRRDSQKEHFKIIFEF